jgi:hypothetical protein
LNFCENFYEPKKRLSFNYSGKWSRDINDDLELPDGSPGPRPESLPIRDLHEKFAQQYRLKETRGKNIPQSLFWHNPISHSDYDDIKFEPKFEITQEDLDNNPDAGRVCSDSKACIYDLIVTQDSDYASQTKKDEAAAELIHRELTETVIRCPALPKPKNGRKSENRYWPGTIVRFSCDEGYRLFGYEVRRCREDGLWSWGVDPECIKDVKYKITVAGIFVGIILPVLLLLVLFVICWRREKNSDHIFSAPVKSYEMFIKKPDHLSTNDEKHEKLSTDRQSIDNRSSFIDSEDFNVSPNESHQNTATIHSLKTEAKSALV